MKTIYSNYNLYERFDEAKAFLMEEYPELCTEETINTSTGETKYEPTDELVWDEIYNDDEIEWEDTYCSLKNFFKNKYVIFVGNVGRWDGTYRGGKIGTFENLFREAVEDCAYIEFTDDNGHLYLNCSHHDGSNSFEIKILTDKGYEYSENWSYGYTKRYDYSEEEMHRRIMCTPFLSRLPRFCERVWG